jgi:hypothetical protein
VRPSDLRVSSAVATEVAAAHMAAPRIGNALARAAYAQLVRESDQLFRVVTEPGRPDRVRIAFTTCPSPYDDAAELITSVRRHGVLQVTTAARERDRVHPVMGCEIGGAYDRFRAVHDVLGHACLAVGFDRHAEFATWRIQERWHSPLARRALATELHGEHSVRWTTGRLAEHKAVLFDDRLLRRARIGVHPATPERRAWSGDWGNRRTRSPSVDAKVSA